MIKTLDEKIEQWFIDRNLHEANPVKQFAQINYTNMYFTMRPRHH
ncbi:TPA: hypothetical protein ACGO4V_001196 [Streptococcus suis]